MLHEAGLALLGSCCEQLLANSDVGEIIQIVNATVENWEDTSILEVIDCNCVCVCEHDDDAVLCVFAEVTSLLLC